MCLASAGLGGEGGGRAIALPDGHGPAAELRRKVPEHAEHAGRPLREREVQEAIVEIEVMRADGSDVITVPREQLAFEYRALRGLEPGSVILAATFETTASTTEASTRPGNCGSNGTTY